MYLQNIHRQRYMFINNFKPLNPNPLIQHILYLEKYEINSRDIPGKRVNVAFIASPVECTYGGCTYGGYYGLVVVTPRPPPRPQTLHRSHDNLKNPYRIASIFYM